MIHSQIVLECAQLGNRDYLLESVRQRRAAGAAAVAVAAENPSPHFRIIYFHLRHIFLHHQAATSVLLFDPR